MIGRPGIGRPGIGRPGIGSPGIGSPEPAAVADGTAPHDEHQPGCITCGDVARPMRVLHVDDARGLAVCVDEHERRETVDLGIVEAAAPGDTLLVHAGAALHREPA